MLIHMDPQHPEVDHTVFDVDRTTFHEQYRDAEEALPADMPKPRGRAVLTTAYVDASHAPNRITRRSHTGFIIFVNKAPIIWYSKRQQTVEASAFSSEFIAMKSCIHEVFAYEGTIYACRDGCSLCTRAGNTEPWPGAARRSLQ